MDTKQQPPHLAPQTSTAQGGEGAPHLREEDAEAYAEETERDVVTSGTAQTSEVADRDAQRVAEGQGDGPTLHR